MSFALQTLSFIVILMRWFSLTFLLLTPLFGDAFHFNIGAESAILINAKTGKVLFEKNGRTKSYPASTTKIATALLALHKGRDQLGRTFVADRETIASISPQAKRQSNYRSPSHWIESDSTHIGIKNGEEFRFYDLLYALLVASANDAANVIAQNLSSSIPDFMVELNDYLQKIGCHDSHYTNPHGLHHPDHVSTAYDLALMAKLALQDPLFRKVVSTPRYICPQTNLVEERTFIQGNHLLRNGSHHYSNAIGVKTGYTSAAGKNLVAAAKSDDRELIIVVLGYRGARSELYDDVIKMFESAFNEKRIRIQLLPHGEQKISAKIPGARGKVRTYLTEAIAYDSFPSEPTSVKLTATWNFPPLPIAKGSQIGTVKIIDAQGTTLKTAPLLTLQEIKPTLWHRLSHFRLGRLLAFGGGASLLLLFFFAMRRKPSRTFR